MKENMEMITKADVLKRLGTLMGKELNSQNLHEALFCEEKHKKILVRFSLGKHTYVQYKIKIDENSETPPYADIMVLGNPNTFRMGLEEKNGQMIVNTEPRINFSYL